MEDLLKEAGVKTKKEAIMIAIKAYLNQKRREKLASLIGNYDFGYSLEDLKEIRRDDLLAIENNVPIVHKDKHFDLIAQKTPLKILKP